MGNFLDLFSECLSILNGINLIEILGVNISLLNLIVGCGVLAIMCFVLFNLLTNRK